MQLPFKPILYVMGPAPCPECIPVLGLQEQATAPLLVLQPLDHAETDYAVGKKTGRGQWEN